MPVLPILLALSQIPAKQCLALLSPAALAAIFPLSFYLACKYVTESKVAAYITAILLTLFRVPTMYLEPQYPTLFSSFFCYLLRHLLLPQ